MTQSIPASTIVNVTPNVLSAGGAALDTVGLMLSNSTRVPIGTVASFPSQAAVSSYFGAASAEAIRAGVYFLGFDNSALKPEALLIAQYNQTAVAAYLRGGNISATALSAIQALSGTLAVSMDGYTYSGAVNLSGASSFSAAATTIQTALNTSLPATSSITASFGASFTGNSAGATLTVTAVTGYISVGDTIVTGTGLTVGTTVVAQVSGTTGGAGTYTMSASGTASSAACTTSSQYLNVTVVASGTLAVGQTVTGAGVAAGAIITALGTGTGTTGTYLTNIPTVKIVSESMTTTGTPLVVTYDSQSGGIVITSGVTGVASLAGFATAGTVANGLLLTATLGAVNSQGAAAASPAAFMNTITAYTQNFVSFFASFALDNSGFANRLAMAAWNNAQDDQYVYVVSDSDVTATTTVPATASLGYAITQANYSGTCLCYEPASYYISAAVSGMIASIDFSQTNGRITFKFKSQTGLTPGVTNETVAANLASNGYNFYGAYATRSQNFQFLANGVVSGPFLWLDAYVDQIWLNNALQEAIVSGLTNINAIPYNAAGNALIEALCADPINNALNFGAIVAGVPLSQAQIAEINNQAGANIAGTIQNRGWYLQVLPATAQVRAARQSPPCTLWYTDGGAVQQINLNSIDVQ